MAGRQQVRQEERAPQAQPRKKKRVRRFYNYSLLFTVIFVTVFGLVMIYSASSYTAQLMYGDAGYFMKRQALIAAGGFVVMIIVSKINYHFFAKFAAISYVLSYVLMIAVSLVGRVVNGKRRWLGIGPLSFQPTEFVKVALIVTLAVVITRMGGHINRLKNMVLVGAMALPLAVLVAANNLSSGIIICGIVFVMLFVATKKKLIFGACVGAAAAVYCFAGQIGHGLEAIGLLQSYQLERINVWLNPEAYAQEGGFQVLQGLYAIGSGGFFGKGLGNSAQKMVIPEVQNDMILTVICEELGVFGVIVVLVLFGMLLYRILFIAQNAPDMYGTLVVMGIFAHITLQVFLNIAVVTNILPNTGVTLPFISYGGTSVLFLMAEMGIVLGVSRTIKLSE